MRKLNRVVVKTFPNGVPLTCLDGHILHNTGAHVSAYDAEHHSEDELARYRALGDPEAPEKPAQPLRMTHEVKVEHRVKYDRKPKPTSLMLTFTDMTGQRYQLPVHIGDGGFRITAEIPMWFLTGIPSAAPSRMEIEVNYDEMRGY